MPNSFETSDILYHCVVTDVETGVCQASIDFGDAQATLTDCGSWRVTKRTLQGGRQEGVGLITIDNGRIQFDVIETRGCSILEIRSNANRLGWTSPVKEVINPCWINLENRGGTSWLEGFNEFMVRCGLEFAGAPGLDEFHTITGIQKANLTLHGRIGNLPASKVEVFIDRTIPSRFRLRSQIQEVCFGGPNIQLVSEVSTAAGSSSVLVTDEITNLGSVSQEMMLIYHCNFGSPILEQGARLHIPIRSMKSRDGHSVDNWEEKLVFCGPTPGWKEEVFLIEPLADRQGAATALLSNSCGTLGGSLHWSVEQLPYFTLWKNTASTCDGYVAGLEPGTCFPLNRRMERSSGRVISLEPNLPRRFSVEYRLYDSKAAVDEVRQLIDTLAAC